MWYGMAEWNFKPKLDHDAEAPLYRQLSEQIAQQIRTGQLARGERLPATRELAGLLGLNRTTVSAAYEILEAEGLISGQVGRGSFVTRRRRNRPAAWIGRACWSGPTPRRAGPNGGWSKDVISFAVSRPSRDLFPLDEFRATCATVLARQDLADILQLGSPSGYEPLRRYLLEEARRQHVAGPGDDLLITNGCQQALDLIGRVLLRPGDTVAVEDPLYTGLKNLLDRDGRAALRNSGGRRTAWMPDQLERVLERERPRFLVVTSNFQNPTGATPAAGRRGSALLDAARRASVPVIENDAYGELRYSGEPLPSLKQLDEGGGTVLLRSFSKISFPGTAGGLGGGAEAADRPAAAGQGSCRSAYRPAFAGGAAGVRRIGPAGGAPRAHAAQAGSERLAATLEACARLSAARARAGRGREGGMNLWVRLPEPLDAGELLARAQRGGRDLSAGTVLRGFAAGAGRAAVEFRGPDAGADPRRASRFWANDSGRAGKRGARTTSPRRRWCEAANEGERYVSIFERAVSSESGTGGDAEGRRHHGRHQRRAGEDRRGGRRLGGDGAGARALRHPQRRRRGAHGQHRHHAKRS